MKSDGPGSTDRGVSHLPVCDICLHRSLADGSGVRSAVVDGKTQAGPWANMCAEDYDLYGIGLGTGRGQRLVVQPEVEPGA